MLLAKKKAAAAAWVTNRFEERGSGKKLPCKKKSRPEAGLLGPAAGLDLSLLPDSERHRGCGSCARRGAAEVQT
jgi:hypothetical protein